MTTPKSETDKASLPCPAWVFSNNSNVHVAKDRSWFIEDYTPFKTFVVHYLFSNPIEVIGVGTVNLPVKKIPDGEGAEAHGILRLENVLHAPSAVCNLLGNVLFDKYDFSPFSSTGCQISDKSTKQPVAWLAQKRFYEVELSETQFGPEVGPSPFKSGMAYMIGATWPEEEQERFAAIKSSKSTNTTDSSRGKFPPLTQEERAWIKEHWKNEFKFLRGHGLRIYKRHEREEGREILKVLLRSGESDDKPEGNPKE